MHTTSAPWESGFRIEPGLETFKRFQFVDVVRFQVWMYFFFVLNPLKSVFVWLALLLCSTLVCEMTTPSLHTRIPRMQTDLLLRLNAIVRNPLPFWLKILETSFLLPPSLTQCLGFTSFLCFLSATTRPGIGRSSGHRLYISVRNTKEVRCQEWTPMESHRRKRHRSESSWKSAIARDLCISPV